MKRIILIIAVNLWVSSVSAQMLDTIGALGIQGELSADAFRGIGQMQGALGRVNFQQDLSTLLFDIQSNFMGRYGSLSKSTLNFSGFQGLDCDVGSEAANSFYLQFHNLDIATCMTCKNPSWGYSRIDINNGTDCQGNDNVKMYF